MDQIDNLVDINNNCHISPDDYDFLGRKWRSVTVGNSINVFNFDSSSNDYNTENTVMLTKLNSIEASKSGVAYEAPTAPYCLVPTHFRSSQALSVLVNDVNQILDNIAEVSYEFSDNGLEVHAIINNIFILFFLIFINFNSGKRVICVLPIALNFKLIFILI